MAAGVVAGEVLERQFRTGREQLEGIPAVLNLPTDQSAAGGAEFSREDANR